MSNSLETIEENNLCSRFGICDELTDEEMEKSGGVYRPGCPSVTTTAGGYTVYGGVVGS